MTRRGRKVKVVRRARDDRQGEGRKGMMVGGQETTGKISCTPVGCIYCSDHVPTAIKRL
jgi:hypothetical protein